ncbi:hypothetical protein [Phaffia rhodozyma]|uniref:Uncharacterized protein n=1 Tax=Phaffia rhodozyma TaxID=264483 RepID=A0A0F7SKD7_PHARH|nr:hypothetical protein [Phaffia rhodozyma]
MANSESSSISTKIGSLFNKAKDSASQAAGSIPSSSQYPAIDSIQHQLRSFQQHYIPLPTKSADPSSAENTKALQWAITSQKGVALDFLSVKRDGTLASKEILEWGKGLGEEDLVDATDRMAYLSFMAAQLSGELARELDIARAPLKELRNLQQSIELKGYRLKEAATKKKVNEDEVAILTRDLTRLQETLPLKRRQAIVKSNELSWKAYTEYSSKLLLLSHASSSLIPTLASNEWDKDFASHVRSSAQAALDNYKPGKYINIINWPEAGLTPSFGETHSEELSLISRDPHSGIATTTRSDSLPSDVSRQQAPAQIPSSINSAAQSENPFESPLDAPRLRTPSPPLGTGQLNLNLVQLPVDSARSSSASSSFDVKGSQHEVGTQEGLSIGKGVAPTVAETGVPLIGGGSQSGSASGRFEKRASSGHAREELEAARAALNIPTSCDEHHSSFTFTDSSALSTSNIPTTVPGSFPAGAVTDQTDSIETRAREERIRRGSETEDEAAARKRESDAENKLPEYSTSPDTLTHHPSPQLTLMQYTIVPDPRTTVPPNPTHRAVLENAVIGRALGSPQTTSTSSSSPTFGNSGTGVGYGGPSVTLFSLVFVIVGLLVVAASGTFRFYYVRRSRSRMAAFLRSEDEIRLQRRQDFLARGGGRHLWGSMKGDDYPKVKPVMWEAELGSGEKSEFEGLSVPLSLSTSASSSTSANKDVSSLSVTERISPPNQLTFSVFILPPRPPLDESNPPPITQTGEEELPELEVGVTRIYIS